MDDSTGTPGTRRMLRANPALRAVLEWSDAEFYLGTASGERRWNGFWDTVRACRRWYARRVAVSGLVVGVATGQIAANVMVEPGRNKVLAGFAYLAVFGLAWYWGQLLSRSIAPLFLRNAQRTARAVYVVVALAVLALSSLFSGSSWWWAFVAGTLVALPWLASAYIETHRAVPAYPATWRVFDSG